MPPYFPHLWLLPPLPHSNSCWGKPCVNGNKRSQSTPPSPLPASCAPACAQSTTQHSQVNYCESHQRPNSAVFLRPGDQLTFETNSRPASYCSNKKYGYVQNSVAQKKELANRFKWWNNWKILWPLSWTFLTAEKSLMMIWWNIFLEAQKPSSKTPARFCGA